VFGIFWSNNVVTMHPQNLPTAIVVMLTIYPGMSSGIPFLFSRLCLAGFYWQPVYLPFDLPYPFH